MGGYSTGPGSVTLIDVTSTFIDDVDPTKVMRLQLSGITTATTRTLTVPDASGTIALTAAAANMDMQNNVISNIGGAGTDFGSAGELAIGPTVSAAGVTALTVTQGAHTAITANVPSISVPAVSLGISTGATIAIGSLVHLAAQTYTGVAGGAAETITDAATLYISGAPIQGANATLTNPYALWIDDGASRFDGNVGIGLAGAATTRLHVSGSTVEVRVVDESASGSPKLSFYQTSSERAFLQFQNAINLLRLDSDWDVGLAPNNTVALTASAVGGRIRIGTGAPAARLHLSDAASSAAWGVNGIGIRSDAETYTDTSSSGTVATAVVHAVARPTLAASNSTTYTDTATFYIANSPIAGSNVTQTNPYALWVDAGITRLDGTLSVQTSLTPAAVLDVQGTFSAANSLTAGTAFNMRGGTLTNTTSSGTVATMVANSFQRPTLAATSTTTFTDVATVYIANSPLAGSNVTLSGVFSLWVDNGYTRLDDRVLIATPTTVASVVNIRGTETTSVALGVAGTVINVQSGTTTDTASSGTVADNAAIGFAPITFATTNAVTYTNASNVYIRNVPVGGANTTILSAHALALSGATTQPSAAGRLDSVLFLPGETLTYTGSTGITSVGPSVISVGQMTITDASSLTIDSASSIYVAANPARAGSVTLTNSYGLWIDEGKVRFDGGGTSAAASGAGMVLEIQPSTTTGRNASGTIAIGAVVSIGATTIAGDTATLTLTNAATLYIADAPTAGTNAAITTPYAIWVDAGNARFDGTILSNGGATTICSATGNLASANGANFGPAAVTSITVVNGIVTAVS